LLDEPYPPNLPAVHACLECNARASRDEEYLACLIECARAGSVSEGDVEREKVRRILRARPLLRERLRVARRVSLFGDTAFSVEGERVRGVVVKLARGHAAFELNEPQYDEPSVVGYAPLCSIHGDLRLGFEEAFETLPSFAPWPEVGSRATQRLMVCTADGLTPSWVSSQWVVVQEDRYRYLTQLSQGLAVRIVISEYLACEVIWT
jgi:hypothetical protein